jgi:phosphoesterase RecJ-like protein
MSLSKTEATAAEKAVKAAERILVIPHANVDPDGLSSALACYQIFTALGKEVTVICPDNEPESLEFLPGFDRLEHGIKESQNFVVTVSLEEGVEIDKLRYTVEDHKVNIIIVPKKGRIMPQHISLGEGGARYDLIVVVDSADLSLLGSVYTENIDLFSRVPVLNIDHHISNSGFGQIQMVDPTAASATEVLYQWFSSVPEWRDLVSEDVATLLLTGLITDTRSFQNPNTTPRSLEVAAELLEKGARQQEIIQHIYKTKPLSTLRIWGRALNRIQIDEEAKIVWSAVSREDLAEMAATSKETSGILDELISTVPNADAYVLFTELEEGGMLKASMRSSPAINASALAARLFGGGGHPRAAGFRVSGFHNFQIAVLETIQKLRDGMELQRREGDEVREPLKGVKTTPTTKARVPAAKPAKEIREKPKQKKTPAIDIVEELEHAEDKKKGKDVRPELE